MDLVSPVADRDSRDQERRGKHDDPVRLKVVARNVGARFEMWRGRDRYLRLM